MNVLRYTKLAAQHCYALPESLAHLCVSSASYRYTECNVQCPLHITCETDAQCCNIIIISESQLIKQNAKEMQRGSCYRSDFAWPRHHAGVDV